MIVFFACHDCRASTAILVDGLAQAEAGGHSLSRVVACQKCDRVVGIIGSQRAPYPQALVTLFGRPASQLVEEGINIIYIQDETSSPKPPASTPPASPDKPAPKTKVEWTG